MLYAGGYFSVYRSDDGGDHWYVADNIYDSYSTGAVAVHPTDPDIFYTGARRLVQNEAEHTPSGFFKSVSGAGDGNLVLKNSGMEDTFVLDIAQDPLDPDILYAGTWGSGLFRSDNGGADWHQVNRNLANRYIYAVEATKDGANPVLYVGTFYSDSGVFKSLDRGETWSEVSAGSELYPTMFDVVTTGSADTLAAATSRGAFWSNDGGATWSPSTGLVGGEHGMVLGLAHLPGTSKLLAATYGGGVWTSVDAGHSWTETSTGLGRQEIFDVIFSPTEFNTAYAATEGVYRSVDGGDWSPVGSLGDWVRALDAAGGPPPDVFAGANVSGVHWLPGGSSSWLPINTGLTEQRIRALKAVAPDKLFAGTNGGSAWEYTFGARSSGLADPQAPAAVEGTNYWTKRGPYLTEPTAPGVIQIAIHPDNADIIYAGTDQGVYRSEDGGETWVPKNKNLGGYGALVISGLAIDPNTPTTIYLGTWGYGIYRSTDSGDTWERLFDPLKMSQIYLPLVLRSYVYVPTIPLVNGDFEQGRDVGWYEYSEQGWELIYDESSLPVEAHGGEWAAWLGEDNNEFCFIWQDATVPSSDPTLRFYRWDESEDACGNDYGIVFIDGDVVAAWELCQEKNTNRWVWSGVDLSPYAGQTVEIAIAALTNESNISATLVDDVTLGSTRQADSGAQEELLVLDPAVSKQGLSPDASQAEEPMQEPWFLPLQEPIEPHGLLNLSD